MPLLVLEQQSSHSDSGCAFPRLEQISAAVLSNDGSGDPSPDFALTVSIHSPPVIQPRQRKITGNPRLLVIFGLF
jgi:hypothetical protein